jgi:UDP-GlcNAc:undecaprenyl-phosphate GlcNAc-1-phosphate transferase
MDYTIFAPCLCALIFGFVLTYPLRKLAPKLGFMDIPKDGRRMHTEPIPRIGGLAIYVAFLLAMCVTRQFSLLAPYACGGGIIVILGILDDKISLNASAKIAGQTVAGVILCLFGITVDTIQIFGLRWELGILAYPATIFLVISVTNIFNLIDGLDGLCCGLSIIAAGCLGLLAFFSGNSDITACALVFVCACLGFLPHNTYRAKIFMGDTGAMFCGLTLAALCCETVFSSEYTLSALTPFAVLGIPVFDTAFAIVRRLCSGSGVFVGDKKHVHHRLSGRYGHFFAVVLLYAAAILLAGVALIINAPGGVIFGSILLALCLIYAIVRFGVYKG